MINTAALFSTAILPGQAGFDTEAITGLAEWRLATPMLFKLLIGAGTQAVAWPIYGDGEDCPCVLAAPMAQAQASWPALSALMDRPRDAASIVARSAISALLAGGHSGSSQAVPAPTRCFSSPRPLGPCCCVAAARRAGGGWGGAL